jgi:hypothetical protein
MPKAVAHDRADTLLCLLGVEVAHPLTQAGCYRTPAVPALAQVLGSPHWLAPLL